MAPSSRPTVLLMDDEPNLLTTMAIILNGHGFEVTTCDSVDGACQLARERPFEFLLADLGMPGDGAVAVAAMRRQQPHASIIVITGHIMPGDIPPEVNRLADEILFKPVEIDELLAIMRRLKPAE